MIVVKVTAMNEERGRQLAQEVVTEVLQGRIKRLARENLEPLKFIQDVKPRDAWHSKERLKILHRHGLLVKKNPGNNYKLIRQKRGRGGM